MSRTVRSTNKVSPDAANATRDVSVLQNSRASEDLRVRRTRQLIADALIDLTTEKGFAAVSVRDLCQRAGINRATFYRHYQDKFDLLDRYADAVYELLDAPSPVALPVGPPPAEPVAPGLVRMFDHIRANARFYRVMLGQNGDPAFAGKVRQFVEKRMRRSLPAALLADPDAAGLYLSCMSGSALGALLWWLEHAMPYSSEAMADFSYRLSLANVSAMLDHANRPTSRQTRRGLGLPPA
jgi:AcrR family transcriptional regulator